MIVCRVQAHPSRTELHRRLLPLLEPLPTELMLHESVPPDPWENYRRCLTYDGYATHLVVVQDDAVPAVGFADAVARISARWPDTPVCLFMGALPASTAVRVRRAKPNVRYLPLSPAKFVPLVAVLWPVMLARRFAAWSETARGLTICDDHNAALWMRASKQTFMVTVPSIVQHDDSARSVKGGRDHVPWAESWRQALLLADECGDYEW